MIKKYVCTPRRTVGIDPEIAKYAGKTTIRFLGTYSTKDPHIQEFLENHKLFKAGYIRLLPSDEKPKNMDYRNLVEYAKTLGIKGGKMKKDELIALIKETESENSSGDTDRS